MLICINHSTQRKKVRQCDEAVDPRLASCDVSEQMSNDSFGDDQSTGDVKDSYCWQYHDDDNDDDDVNNNDDDVNNSDDDRGSDYEKACEDDDLETNTGGPTQSHNDN